jgi:hypothetical protein
MMVVAFQVTMREGGRRTISISPPSCARARADRRPFSVERFQSLAEPGKCVSLSFWRDPAVSDAWRTQRRHRAAQGGGKREIFVDFRISVAELVRDYTLQDRWDQRTAAPL